MAQTYDSVDSLFSDAAQQAMSPKQKTTAATKAKDTAVGDVNRENIGGEITKALAPEQSVLNALPGEYQSAMSSLQSTPVPKSGDATLDSALAGVSSANEAGEAGVEKALKGEATAGKTLAKDLPYADVMNAELTQKKNEILYGPQAVTTQIDTSHWSEPLQDIYDYINGSVASPSTGQSASLSSADALPSVTQAAAGNNANGTAGIALTTPQQGELGGAG